MNQQYDHLQTVNLSKDRSPDVLAAINALESEGFYQGSDDIDCDIKTVTSFNEWEIKAGYSDTCLYITVVLKDGSRWVALENCEEEFPTYKQLLTGDPTALGEQLTAIKRKKYERMMQAISWVKELIAPKPKLSSEKVMINLTLNKFQCLGTAESLERVYDDWNDVLGVRKETIPGWDLACVCNVWRKLKLIHLHVFHQESKQVWHKFCGDEEALQECFEGMNQVPPVASESGMAKAITWVKEILGSVPPPPPKKIQLLTQLGFQDLGDVDEYEDIDTGMETLDSYQSEIIDGWQVKCLHREDNITFLDVVHVESNRYFQDAYTYIPGVSASAKEMVEDIKQILCSNEEEPA